MFFLINTSLQRGDFGDTLIQLSRFNGLAPKPLKTVRQFYTPTSTPC
ncbi:MAG: hypothetical protein QOH70_1750 [Blastocatellia bacterium]|nr:hypothetical protein [Blastocatellia bacterium]